MDQSSVNQNRRTRRSRVLLQAEIEVGGSALPVKLRDISVAGALIEGERLPIEGTCVLLRRNDLLVNSRVIWSDGTHAGLAFDTPIQREEVLRTIRPAQPKPWQQKPESNFRRPGLKLSPEEEALIKLMIAGVVDLTRR